MPTHIRSDVDCIFMPSSAALARQVKPLLNYHYAGHLPVYATSRIYEGVLTQNLDKDLENIMFCDMPYIIDSHNRLAHNNLNINPRWHDKNPQNARLFALGYDAFNLAHPGFNIKQLNMQTLPGLTGDLSLNSSQSQIDMAYSFAQFKSGKPVIETY